MQEAGMTVCHTCAERCDDEQDHGKQAHNPC
jgi:hypothetical protein